MEEWGRDGGRGRMGEGVEMAEGGWGWRVGGWVEEGGRGWWGGGEKILFLM